MAALILLIVASGARPVAADTRPAPCSVPVDPAQDRLDAKGIGSAHASGLDMRVVRQCAGFSIVAQETVDSAEAEEYASFAEQAYVALSAETGRTLSPRAVVFVYSDQDGMADGERIIGGIPQLTREPHAGYAWMNSIWLDASALASAPTRARAVTHEFSHVFAAAVAHGKAIPSWFDEGLAVHSEVSIPADTFPLACEGRAGQARSRVLDALSGTASRPLFGLDEIDTNRKWLANFADAEKASLQYAQAYETVRSVLGSRGRGSAWAMLAAFGESGGHDFDAAFRGVYGKTPMEYDALARSSWKKELTIAPDSLQLTVRIAPSGDGAPVELNVFSRIDNRRTMARGTATPSSAYVFEIGQRGDLVQTRGDHTEFSTVPESDDPDVRGEDLVAVYVRHANGASVEQVALRRSYGRWTPYGEGRGVISVDEDRAFSFTVLRGPMSEPFPSGDSIVANYTRA